MNQTTKRILLWVAVALGLLLFLWLLSKLGTAPGPTTTTDRTFDEQLVVANEHLIGNPEGTITMVEYSDFQCPYCADMYPTLKRAVEEFPDDVRLIYRHFPLRASHPNAQLAAQASEAAANQGKFWEMHDAIFNTQDQWSANDNPEEFFVRLAVSLGLDENQFKTDLTANDTAQKVNADAQSANKLRLSGTPTIFINEIQYQFSSYGQLKQIIETERKNP